MVYIWTTGYLYTCLLAQADIVGIAFDHVLLDGAVS